MKRFDPALLIVSLVAILAIILMFLLLSSPCIDCSTQGNIGGDTINTGNYGDSNFLFFLPRIAMLIAVGGVVFLAISGRKTI